MSTALLGLAAPSVSAAPAPSEPAPSVKKELDSRDRGLLAEAEQAGKPEVTILVAAEKGRSDAAADELRSLGAVVRTVEKSVGYVKATLSPDAVGKAVKLGSVRALDVDGVVARDDPAPEEAESPLPQPAPGPDTPRVNPYMPTGDTKAAQFGQLFPSWDGKDVTVAIVDTGVDLDHPSLTKTSRGEHKIVDWYTANPVDKDDGTWVQMSSDTFNGAFTADGRSWTAPATGGPFSFGVFAESRGDLGQSNTEIQGNVNRDGDKTDRFGVLQDVVTKRVRVDLNENGDFTDEKPMIDYKVAQDVGHFGVDNPATPERVERVPFVVQTDKSVYSTAETPFVNIGIAGASHGSHVAGIAAGNALFDGKMAGAAPGAKLMSIKACLTTPTCTAVGELEGVLYAAKNGADVVNVSIGSLQPVNDGNSAGTVIFNRIIAEFDVQLFFGAGNNGSGLNTVGDSSIATDVVSIGSYISSATRLSNYGSQTAQKDSLHVFSSRGPREDGGFKPDIVAPGSAISTIPLWRTSFPVAGTFELPNGYAHIHGTSMASPAATGAAALLVSAYKQTHGGKRPSATALRNAIYSSARYIDQLGAYEQGNGLFDVFGAFFRLAANPNPDAVTASVGVHTVLSDQLPTPGVGTGIHDREGVRLGQKYTRTYTFTRTSGSANSVPYKLKWVDDDGTFSSLATVNLPLNSPVKVDVRIDPAKTGVHSAVLQLDNPLTSGVDHRTMNVVVVPAKLDAGSNFTFTASGKVARNQTNNFFVPVPEGTTGLKIDMQAGGPQPGAGQVRFMRIDPRGIPADSAGLSTCYNPDTGGGCPTGSPTSRAVTNPMPGVWEFFVEANLRSDVAEAPFSITATVVAAQITPNPDTIESVQIGVPVAREYSVSNNGAGFTGRLAGGPLNAAVTLRPDISQDEEQEHEITVLPGSTSLRVAIKNPAVPDADLDLFLLDCTSGNCVQKASSADADSDEVVSVVNPAPGQWIAVVQGFGVPTGTTTYDYTDMFATPSLGNVAVDDADTPRPTGTVWNAPATVTVLAVPPAGRKLGGELAVRTSDGVIIGRGVVQINSVS